MRDIKFRGLTDEKKWVYGYLHQRLVSADEVVFCIQEKPGTDTEVIPKSIGQYTGLKDKNGVEVYEGDILQLFYGKENTPLTTTKVFFNGEGYWDSKNLSEQHPFRACYGGFNKCEVVGNVYENPGLLKKLKEGE